MEKEDKVIEYLKRRKVVEEVKGKLTEDSFYIKEIDTLKFSTRIWENRKDNDYGIFYNLDEWMKPLIDFYKEKGIKVLHDKVKANNQMKFIVGFKEDENTDKGLAIKEERRKYIKRELDNYLGLLAIEIKHMTRPDMVEYVEGYVDVSYGGYCVPLVTSIPKRIVKEMEKGVKELVDFWEQRGLDMNYEFRGEEGCKFYDLIVEIREK